MATMTAAVPDEKTNQMGSRQTGRGTRRIRLAAEQENVLGVRFFLSKSGANGSSPELGEKWRTKVDQEG